LGQLQSERETRRFVIGRRVVKLWGDEGGEEMIAL